MAKKIDKTPNNDLPSRISSIWKEHKVAITIIALALILLFVAMLYFQCAANKEREWKAVIWNDFKIIGWYVFGLLSPTIISLVSKFHNYLNK